MNDKGKTKEQLLEELAAMRLRIDQLEAAAASRQQNDPALRSSGAIREMTGRKETEKSLPASEKIFSAVFHLHPYPITLGDADTGKLIDVNEAFTSWTGYSREEVIGVSPADLQLWIPAENHERIAAELRAGKIWEGRMKYRHLQTGRLKNVRATMFTIKDKETEQPICIVNIAHDGKWVEKYFQQAKQTHQSIFENAQEGIYRSTTEGRFITANQAMARILGYESPEELIGCVTDIAHQLYVHPEQRVKLMERLEHRDFVKDAEIPFYRKDRRIIWVSRTVRAIRNQEGSILYLDGIIDDITERKKNIDQLRRALGGAVQAISLMVEKRDPYTAGHQHRVSDLARAIATEMNLSDDQINGLRMAGIIHDIGKISIPSEILNSPKKLTNLEFSMIKTHAQSGYDIVKDIEFPWPIARIILEHHERINGSGYPNGLTGDNLLPESRILSIADVVEAMATHRPYRPALGIDAALEEITRNKGVLYDSEAVDACLRLFRKKGYKIKQ